MPYDRRSGALPRRFDEKNGEYNRSSYTDFGFMYFINQSMNESIKLSKTYLLITNPKRHGGLVVKHRTQKRKVGVRSSLSGSCNVLEQDNLVLKSTGNNQKQLL